MHRAVQPLRNKLAHIAPLTTKCTKCENENKEPVWNCNRVEESEINLSDIFNEEKWTRAAITNYSINNFKELDALIEEAKRNHYLDELKKLSDEHLSHNKTSITALYISSIIALSKQLLDDSSLITLVTIFIDVR